MKRLKLTLYIAIIAITLLNLTIVYSTNLHNETIEKYLRIHVVANSDSIDDQILKYTVAKQVEEFIQNITSNCNSKEDSKKTIESNMDEILNICKNTISSSGYDYDIKAYLGKIQYDEKYKDNSYMKSGIYDSLKIVIGNGNGQNWWSLIYPTNLNDILESDDITYSIGILELIKNGLHFFDEM